jgi:hypothetical protein
VKRVLELELASNGTPQRVELVARALFKMSPPTPDRIISMGPAPQTTKEVGTNGEANTSLSQEGSE